MENYIDFTMETTEKWVALGHDSAGRMVSKAQYFVSMLFWP